MHPLFQPLLTLLDALTNDHPIFNKKAFVASFVHISTHSSTEPSFFKIVLTTSQWKAAMEQEYQAFMKQGTWRLAPLPPNKNLVSCKWILKLKKKTDVVPLQGNIGG